MLHAYLSHAPEDLDEVLQLHEALRRAAIPDFQIPPGAPDEDKAAADGIERAFCMIVLVSTQAQKSRRVRHDIELAVARGLTILPVRLDGARLNGLFRTEIGPRLSHSLRDEAGMDAFVAAVQERYRRRCPVVAVMNLKGGVGKTTVSAQVFGAFQAETRGRVLLIDFDPQYNLTQFFFTMQDADRSSLADRSVISLFERSRLHYPDIASPAESWTTIAVEPFEPAPRSAIVHGLLAPDLPGWLDIVTGQFEISKYAFATDASALAAIRKHFLRCIDQFRAAYDLIVFDTNPNATFLTTCALEAADAVIAPMHADEFSLRGVKLLHSLVNSQLAPDQRPHLHVLFNAVGRNEQSDFEADARAGAFDARVGFELSKALLHAALPRSNFFQVQGAPEPETRPHTRLLVHHGRGGGLRQARERLRAVVLELQAILSGQAAEH